MQQPSETFEVVNPADDAIETEAMTPAEMMAFIKSRDTKQLKIRAGQQPARFICREVPNQLWESFVCATEVQAERYRRAFQCGVIEAKNIPQRVGGLIGSFTPAGMPEALRMSDADLGRFSPHDREEIGYVIYERSFLAPRTVRAYQLLPSSQAILEDREFRRADASPPSPAPSSSEASCAQAVPSAPSNATATEPPSSVSACGTATAATATTGQPFAVQSSAEAASTP